MKKLLALFLLAALLCAAALAESDTPAAFAASAMEITRSRFT